MEADPIIGYVVHATRMEPGDRLRAREFFVGIADSQDAAHAVIVAFPELDDGFHVEATIAITPGDARGFDVVPGQILVGAEKVE